MADNTDRPTPPLPFGNPTTAPRTLFAPRDAVGGGSLFNAAEGEVQAVKDITSLVGAKILQKFNVRGEIGLEGGGTQANKQAPYVRGDRYRRPWVLTCQRWLAGDTQDVKDGRYILAHVNPREVQWQLPQRSVAQKTRRGEVLHIWRDRFRGTFYDEPKISITFQSGNIMPIREKPFVKDAVPEETTLRQKFAERPQVSGEFSATGGQATSNVGFARSAQTRQKRRIDPSEVAPRVPPGLDNFYEFLALVDEQKILDNGDVNYCYIIYNSRMFPNITLAGLFTPDGVTWTDTSDDPNQVNAWTANFTIYDSYPRIHDPETLRNFFRFEGFGRV